jgi:hypothetical protein
MRNSFKIANKMLLTMGATVIAGGMLAGTQPASAANIGPPASGEPSLQNELDNLVDPNNLDAKEDQTGEELFTSTAVGASATLAFENAGMGDDNEFGIYKAGNTDKKATLIDGESSPGDPPAGGMSEFNFASNGNLFVDGTLAVEDFGTDFGFFLNNGNDKTLYSEASLNPGDKQQSVIYQGGSDIDEIDIPGLAPANLTETDRIIAFEDLANQGDGDFNDMGVVVSDVEPVPEPSAMAALGLVGGVMAFARRRRQ